MLKTIATGMRAAAKGGFSSVCTMPNTLPAVDNEGIVKFIISKSKEAGGFVNVFPVASATKGRESREMTEIGSLKEAGAVAVTDDGDCINDTNLLRRILQYSDSLNIPVLEHCEDMVLTSHGVMREGVMSTKLGLKGIPAESEEIMVARDIFVSKLTKCPVHIQHVSSAGSVSIIRWAKKNGIKVTAETAPHYLVLTDEALADYNTAYKVKPPIGNADDREALIEGLIDGTIDVIASDHAPHVKSKKEVEFDYAPFGMIGLETSLPLVMENLVAKNRISLKRMVELMSASPARIMNLSKKGALSEGFDADITIIDDKKEVEITCEYFESKSVNSPFKGMKCKGVAVGLVVNGKIVMKDGKVL